MERMVRGYMASPEYDELVTKLMSSKSTMDEDCEDLLENFFAGAWYYLSVLQVRSLQSSAAPRLANPCVISHWPA
jgi:hypothetical protein